VLLDPFECWAEKLHGVQTYGPKEFHGLDQRSKIEVEFNSDGRQLRKEVRKNLPTEAADAVNRNMDIGFGLVYQ